MYIVQEICTYAVTAWTYEESNISNGLYMSGLFVLYLVTMLYTFDKLKLLGIGNLKAEQKATFHQFSVFAVAYVTRAC